MLFLEGNNGVFSALPVQGREPRRGGRVVLMSITMRRKKNKKLIPFARQLRRAMTKEEKHLWYDFLSNYPVRFYRQKIFGKYIADFYCAKARLVIELDGSQHFGEAGAEHDARRTEFFGTYGIKVLRFTNLEICDNFRGVCEHIDGIVRTRAAEICLG